MADISVPSLILFIASIVIAAGVAGPGQGAADGPPDEAALRRMMQDPRYWRQRDPAFVQQVTEGFRRLYG